MPRISLLGGSELMTLQVQPQSTDSSVMNPRSELPAGRVKLLKIFVCEPMAHYEYSHANADTQNLARGLSFHGNVTLISYAPFSDPLRNMGGVTYQVAAPREARRGHAPSRPILFLDALRTALFAARFARREKPDLMIWPNGDAFSVLLASWLSGGIICKLVMHNSVVGPGAKTGWRFRLYWLWEKYFLRKLALRGGLLTPSAQIREDFQKNHGITLEESQVIPIGVNIRTLPPSRPFQSRVLVLGVINSRKNYPCAIEGFLAQKGFQSLILAGVLHDERIAGLIREKDTEGRIHLIDRYIQEEELEGLFESVDVALLPHGLGSTLASGTLSRALEFGVPIIGPKEGYIADWVTRYEIGSLFRPDDAASLASVLQESGSNYPALYERFESGYERLSQERSWRMIAQKYL